MKYKHIHGTTNQIIQQEEKAILLAVDRALSSSSNSQIVGKNGELPILDFLNRYLPPTFKVASGHFITPKGNLSPQLDIMVMDSRYPLLSQNLDGSVLAMLHSIIYAIEVKTNITSSDVKKICENTKKIQILINEIDQFCSGGCWSAPRLKSIAYRCKTKLETIEKSFIKFSDPIRYFSDMTILRFSEHDGIKIKDTGCELHFEPIDDVKLMKDEYGIPDFEFKGDFLFGTRASYTPLSDFYYRLVQDGYYILGDRNFSFIDLGRHVMEYMSWSTALWDDIFE